MARISTYDNDTSINDHDRLIGTDGGIVGDDGQIVAGTAGLTKNFLLSELRDYFDGQSGLQLMDFDVPMSLSGALVDSLISQDNTTTPDTINIGRFTVNDMNQAVVTEGADLRVAGNISMGGHLLDLAGDEIITPSGQTQLQYHTATINGDTSMTPISPYTVAVISGTGIKLLPQNPNDGDWVKIVNLSQNNNNERVMLSAGSRRFMNDRRDGSNTLILNDQTVSFELVYVGKQAGGGTSTDVDDHVGWVIVGAR